MTTVHPSTAVLDLPLQAVDGAPVKPGPDRLAVGILVGALVFLTASVIAFSVNWKVGIPVLVAASIPGVLLMNRAVSAGLVVDEEPGAFARMLVANEKGYGPVLTGVEAEWAALTGWARIAVDATVHPVARGMVARSNISGLFTRTSGVQGSASSPAVGSASD